MGVTGLWKLIDQSGKPVPVDTLENKVLAVDISIWLHQVVKGFQDANGATLPNAHLLGLFHRLCKLMYYRIKPVFVFDGGVPPLKRETIAKRARNKSKYLNEADKLQHLLLEALAKEKVVQQALGPSAALLTSGTSKKAIKKAEDDDENDLFKLPPMQEDLPKDDSFTDISEGDGSFDEKQQRTHYSHNIQKIDVKSSHFQSLPADIRHEILSDIKETRKQSSWGRLHELPVESQSFSSFQMKRLLKRRQVQVELEEAEKEMGGKGLSMAELENLLSEEGVVDPDIVTERVASNEHVRYLHVRDITKALKKEADEKVKTEKIKEEKAELKDIIKKENLTTEDFDLQKAIEMSLSGEDTGGYGTGENSNNICLTVEQRKALGPAANSLARHYMVEYGGLNDDEVTDLVKLDEPLNQTQEFKFNDPSIIFGKGIESVNPSTSDFKGKEISQKLNIEKEKIANLSESSSDEEDMLDVSSDIDSDFVDVPEVDSDVDVAFLARSKFPLPPPFLMNLPPDVKPTESDDSKIEVVINPGQMFDLKDDIFADVFCSPVKNEEQITDESVHEESAVVEIDDDDKDEDDEDNDRDVNLKDKSIEDRPKTPEAIELSVDTDVVTPGEEKSEEVADVTFKSPSKEKSSGSKIRNILNDLDNEKSAITKLSLDDLLGTKSSDDILEKLQTTEKSVILDKLEIGTESNEQAKPQNVDGSENDPKKLDKSTVEETTPTKIPQPFFVKKTPPSSKKKSPDGTKADNDLTPSKASKSLTEVFDSLPSTSSKPVSEEETMAMAANVLREQKTKEELEDIAEQLNQERRDLAAERNKRDRLGTNITEQMSMECMELLRLFGVPYIIAPMEAEAQCAYLNEICLTDGTITDDSDIWLFGGQTVYKNFFDQNKHVLEFKSDNIQRLFHLDRQKLIQLSFLVGSDYTSGIHGIGAVTALEILSLFAATPEKDGETTQIVSILSSLRKFRDWWFNKSVTQRTNTLRSKLKNITITEEFPNPRVVEAYLFPTVDENREKFTWGKMEVESIREYAKKTFGWTNKRTDEIIMPVFNRLNEKKQQQSIHNYFKITDITSRKDLKVSKRVRIALEQMSADPDATIEIDDDDDFVVEQKKPKKKPAKTTSGGNNSDTVNAKPKPKPRGKRKAAAETQQTEAPSTSTNGAKKVVLPDTNAPIPQREMDKQIMEQNKLKAIEILKKADRDATFEIDDDDDFEVEQKKPKKKPAKTAIGESSKRQRKPKGSAKAKPKQETDGGEPIDAPANAADDENQSDTVNAKSKPKPRRKRKAAAEDEQTEARNTSTNGAKKVVLPDTNAPIPQREMDKQIMEQNKLKAIEILKKVKMGKKK